MKHAEWNREVMNHATIVYQRRHRNWALKRARGGLLLQNGIYVLSDLWEKRAHKAEAEVRRLQAVFDMQQTRMDDATVMWQTDTGKHDTLPDLGVLLDWLMGEIK